MKQDQEQTLPPGAGLDIAPIEARLKAATPGSWIYEFNEGDWGAIVRDSYGNLLIEVHQMGLNNQFQNDGEFIANAPADIAALVAEVKRLRGQLKLFFEVLTDEELLRVRKAHFAKLAKE